MINLLLGCHNDIKLSSYMLNVLPVVRKYMTGKKIQIEQFTVVLMCILKLARNVIIYWIIFHCRLYYFFHPGV